MLKALSEDASSAKSSAKYKQLILQLPTMTHASTRLWCSADYTHHCRSTTTSGVVAIFYEFLVQCRGVRTWGKEGTIPRAPYRCGAAEWLRGRRRVPAMSQVISSRQYIWFRKISGWNTGRQTCFLPRAPSNLVTPLVQCMCVLAYTCIKHKEPSIKCHINRHTLPPNGIHLSPQPVSWELTNISIPVWEDFSGSQPE